MKRMPAVTGILLIPVLLLSCASPAHIRVEPNPSEKQQIVQKAVSHQSPNPYRTEIEGDREDPDTSPVIAYYQRTMSLRQKIGQLFISWLPGSKLSDEVYMLLEDAPPAGFIVYPWNYSSKTGLKHYIGALQDEYRRYLPGLSAFFCADQEGGRVEALRFDEFCRFPSAFDRASYNDPQYIYAAAYVNAVQMKAVGVNMNLAPVLDLYPYRDNTIIGDRSFGADPADVSRYGKSFIDGSRDGGVVPVAKHFPGHGSSTVDSHGSLPTVELTLAELEQSHLLPFKAVVDAQIEAIMTAHILFPRIDPQQPASLSDYFIEGLLRNQMGFDGVVMSDGFEMRALSDNYSVKESLQHTISAGTDLILLYTRYNLSKMIDLVVECVAEGSISLSRIDESLERILALKVQYGLAELPAAEE
jgi:beta-N-acetylhexosaminidase